MEHHCLLGTLAAATMDYITPPDTSLHALPHKYVVPLVSCQHLSNDISSMDHGAAGGIMDASSATTQGTSNSCCGAPAAISASVA